MARRRSGGAMIKEKNGAENTASTSTDRILSLDSSDPANVELVFGFVGPTGIDLDRVIEVLKSELSEVQYEATEIRISDLISEYLGEGCEFDNHYDRIKTLMDRGTSLRERTSQADIAGRLAIASIRDNRVRITKDPWRPAPRMAYLVRSFKRPEEVELFRQVYGKAFNLISVYASRTSRTLFLKKLIAQSLGRQRRRAEEFAVELINRDYNEEERKLGQRVGKTFPLADLFITSEPRNTLSKNIRRFVHLAFGNPYISPTVDEQSMFFAKSAALRSLDLSRQVGAAIVTQTGEIISTGCNEVPRFGGGLYWSDDAQLDRDYERGFDSNVVLKREITEDAFDRLKASGLISSKFRNKSSSFLAQHALFERGAYLKDSQLFDVIEFGRAVHAEMDAITQAARLGVGLKEGRLFCTTFPCHICARHIVSSGIKEVVFIEPYEKSRASELFGDSISIEPTEPSPDRVNFRAFVGIAPRRYMDFFELQGARKKDSGEIVSTDGRSLAPRLKRFVFTYTVVEAFALDGAVRPIMRRRGKNGPAK